MKVYASSESQNNTVTLFVLLISSDSFPVIISYVIICKINSISDLKDACGDIRVISYLGTSDQGLGESSIAKG